MDTKRGMDETNGQKKGIRRWMSKQGMRRQVVKRGGRKNKVNAVQQEEARTAGSKIWKAESAKEAVNGGPRT